MVRDEKDYGASYRYYDAPGVDAGNSPIAERLENCAADERPDDSQDEVTHESFAAVVHELAADEAGNKSDNYPCQYAHITSPLVKPEKVYDKPRVVVRALHHI
jgi:hypothetical protein